ncbi:hypothetical protein D3C79_1069020 [compost metagenome]
MVNMTYEIDAVLLCVFQMNNLGDYVVAFDHKFLNQLFEGQFAIRGFYPKRVIVGGIQLGDFRLVPL